MAHVLAPLLCGRWDGCHLWLQWSGDAAAERYEVQVSYRRREVEAWGEWDTVVPPQGPHRDWGVIPTWKENWQVRARVRSVYAGNSPGEWETAREVCFVQGACEFEISTLRQDVRFPQGTTFHAIVDGGSACYALEEEVALEAGGVWSGVLRSYGASGWHQLDRIGHFTLSPAFGVTVRNVAPSRDEVEETGEYFTTILPGPGQPLHLAITQGHAF